ncbi:MAG: hypothetical protein FWE20_09180 [Defluviitaleaceae bacterium]|nr:hypothetical protein [Defluviitaleaceae bacterium]
MTTLKHVFIRLYLSLLLALFFLTGGLALLALAPLYKGAFAPNASYGDFRFFRVWAHVYKVMWRSISSKGYRDLYPSSIIDPPMLNNNQERLRVRESWRGDKDNCDMCENSCCAQINCPMMVNKRCLSYGSLYFGYYFCGRYPNSQSQIDLYKCPKWEVRPQE